jgi:hypothetical protein
VISWFRAFAFTCNLYRYIQGYLQDEALMARLRTLVPRSQELYEFAKKGYHVQWEKPEGTC